MSVKCEEGEEGDCGEGGRRGGSGSVAMSSGEGGKEFGKEGEKSV